MRLLNSLLVLSALTIGFSAHAKNHFLTCQDVDFTYKRSNTLAYLTVSAYNCWGGREVDIECSGALHDNYDIPFSAISDVLKQAGKHDDAPVRLLFNSNYKAFLGVQTSAAEEVPEAAMSCDVIMK